MDNKHSHRRMPYSVVIFLLYLTHTERLSFSHISSVKTLIYPRSISLFGRVMQPQLTTTLIYGFLSIVCYLGRAFRNLRLLRATGHALCKPDTLWDTRRQHWGKSRLLWTSEASLDIKWLLSRFVWHLWDNRPAMKQPQNACPTPLRILLFGEVRRLHVSSQLEGLSGGGRGWVGGGVGKPQPLGLLENNHNLSHWPLSQAGVDINLCSFASGTSCNAQAASCPGSPQVCCLSVEVCHPSHRLPNYIINNAEREVLQRAIKNEKKKKPALLLLVLRAQLRSKV